MKIRITVLLVAMTLGGGCTKIDVITKGDAPNSYYMTTSSSLGPHNLYYCKTGRSASTLTCENVEVEFK